MSEPTLLIDNQEGVCTLTLNRPQAMNSLSLELLRALHQGLDEIAFDPAVRCVIVTGAGEKAFCAGADLRERAGMDPVQVRRCIAQIRGVMDTGAPLPRRVHHRRNVPGPDLVGRLQIGVDDQ